MFGGDGVFQGCSMLACSVVRVVFAAFKKKQLTFIAAQEFIQYILAAGSHKECVEL